MPSSRGWQELKRAGGSPGAGTVTRHDGLDLLSYGGLTDDGEWLFTLIDDAGRGAWAVAETAAFSEFAFEPHGVWVTNLLDDTVSRIDPRPIA